MVEERGKEVAGDFEEVDLLSEEIDGGVDDSEGRGREFDKGDDGVDHHAGDLEEERGGRRRRRWQKGRREREMIGPKGVLEVNNGGVGGERGRGMVTGEEEEEEERRKVKVKKRRRRGGATVKVRVRIEERGGRSNYEG